MQDPKLLGNAENSGCNWEAAGGWSCSSGDWSYWQSSFPCSGLGFYPRRGKKSEEGEELLEPRLEIQSSKPAFLTSRCHKVMGSHAPQVSFVQQKNGTCKLTCWSKVLEFKWKEISKLLASTFYLINIPTELPSLFRSKFETLLPLSFAKDCSSLCAKVKNKIVTVATLSGQLENPHSF